MKLRWAVALLLLLLEWPAAAGQVGGARPAARAVPDYDGRAPAGPAAGELLIWVPRIVFYPVHRVLDSFVRWPVQRLLGLAEQYHVYGWAKRIFLFRDGKAGIFPTFYFEFGVHPSVGFYFFHDDLLFRGHSLLFHGGIWTADWINLDLESRQPLFTEETGLLRFNASYLLRPDRRFFGLGASTAEDDEAHYQINQLRASVALRAGFWGLSRFQLKLGYRRVRFGSGDGEVPSIEERYLLNNDQVPGFAGYDLLRGVATLQLDSRRPELARNGSGVRLELRTSFAVDPGQPELHFLRWSARGGLFWDLTGHGHLLKLSALVSFLEPLGDLPVPFTELVTLGGRSLMRGFVPERFRGLSGLVLGLDYRYPIWAYLDAELFVELGNVFDRHLAGFAWERLFLGWGVAIRARLRRDLSFDGILGFGTGRLDGSRVATDSLHFAMGLTAGF